jgi:hypothetical protein
MLFTGADAMIGEQGPIEALGEAMPTPGLNAFDQVRESSMADEGGMSGAVMESQDLDTHRSPTSRRPLAEGAKFVLRRDAKILAGVCAAGAITALAAFVIART